MYQGNARYTEKDNEELAGAMDIELAGVWVKDVYLWNDDEETIKEKIEKKENFFRNSLTNLLGQWPIAKRKVRKQENLWKNSQKTENEIREIFWENSEDVIRFD